MAETYAILGVYTLLTAALAVYCVVTMRKR